MNDVVNLEPDEASLAELERINDAQESVRNAFVVIVGDHVEDADRIESLMVELLEEEGYTVDAVLRTGAVKRDVRKALETAVIGGADVAITLGGVGFGPRAVTPEATRKILDVRIHGIEQALRASGLAAGSVEAGLSRGVAGISGQTVVVNLAETRSAIRDGMSTLCPLVTHVLADLGSWSV